MTKIKKIKEDGMPNSKKKNWIYRNADRLAAGGAVAAMIAVPTALEYNHHIEVLNNDNHYAEEQRDRAEANATAAQHLADYIGRQRDNASANASAAQHLADYKQGQLDNMTANNTALTQQLVNMGFNITYVQTLLDSANGNYADIYALLNGTVARFQDIYNAYNITIENWGQSNDTHLQEIDDLYHQFQNMSAQQNASHAQAIANLQDLWAQYNLTVYNNGAPTGLSLKDLDYLFEYDDNITDGIDPLPSPLTNEEKNRLMAVTSYIEIRQEDGWDVVKAEMKPAKNANGDYLVNMDTQFVWYLKNVDSGVEITDTLDVDIPSSLYFKIKDSTSG